MNIHTHVKLENISVWWQHIVELRDALAWSPHFKEWVLKNIVSIGLRFFFLSQMTIKFHGLIMQRGGWLRIKNKRHFCKRRSLKINKQHAHIFVFLDITIVPILFITIFHSYYAASEFSKKRFDFVWVFRYPKRFKIYNFYVKNHNL